MMIQIELKSGHKFIMPVGSFILTVSPDGTYGVNELRSTRGYEITKEEFKKVTTHLRYKGLLR